LPEASEDSYLKKNQDVSSNFPKLYLGYKKIRHRYIRTIMDAAALDTKEHEYCSKRKKQKMIGLVQNSYLHKLMFEQIQQKCFNYQANKSAK
jgi:hypothetical protein